MGVRRFTPWGLVFLLLVIGFLPIVMMFVRSVTVDGQLSFGHYKVLVFSGRQWSLLEQSLTLSLLTTLLATGIGVPLGVLFGKSDLPLRRLLTVLFTLPLLLPPYITAVSWFYLLSKGGLVAALFGSQATQITSAWLFGLPGCVLVLLTTFMPIVILLTMTYLKTINPHLEEAARLVASWPAALRSIIIPLVRPGILLASILVFILTLGEFSVPMFLRVNVFPVESFTQFSAFYNYQAGTAAAIPLLLITFFVLLVERVFLRAKTYQLQPFPEGDQGLRIGLGTTRWWVFVLIGSFCFLTIIMPFGALLLQSASLSAYEEAFIRAGGSLGRSLGFAVIGASLLTIFGFFTGYLIHAKALPCWRGVDSLTIFLFALPSTVIGIGLISLWNHPATNLIYATPVIIILGYLAQYTALTSRTTVSSLAQIPPSMEEAAQIVGSGWFRRVIWIIAPLAKRGLIVGWLVGYIFCLRDTGISMLVYPAGLDPLPVRIFTLMANSPAELIAALCVIMMVATLLPMGVLAAASKPRKANP